MMTNQIVSGRLFFFFFLYLGTLIVNSIIANFEFVLNSKLGGLQLLSSKNIRLFAHFFYEENREFSFLF